MAYHKVQLLLASYYSCASERSYGSEVFRHPLKHIKFKMVLDHRICDRDRMEHMDSNALIGILPRREGTHS